MTKNGMIRVFDENGNEIGQTYPKRVNGLIKKGRARFLDESGTAIVLTETEPKIEYTEACPPNNLTLSEDINMATNTAIILENNENNSEEIREETGAMSAELRRLYDKLDEIDGEIFKLHSECGKIDEDEFCALINVFERMRGDIVDFIENLKKPEPPKNDIVEKIYAKQLDALMKLMQEKEEELAERLINDEDFTVTDYETLTTALDARFSKRMDELMNNIANVSQVTAETADNANE